MLFALPLPLKLFLASLIGLFAFAGFVKHDAEIATSTTSATGTSSAVAKAKPAAVPPAPKKQVPVPSKPANAFTASTTRSGLGNVSLRATSSIDTALPSDTILAIEAAIHAGINAERVKNNLPILAYNAKLAGIARMHSEDMLRKGYFSHSDEDACNSGCRLTKAGYVWGAVGENIYLIHTSFKLSPEKIAANIVAGWMASPGHRENILSTLFSEEGIGIAEERDTLYATEDFGHPR